MKDTIEVNPVCKLNSLLSNLTIYNDLVDQIKVAQETDEQLQSVLTSFNFVKNGEGRLCVPRNEKLRSKNLHEAHHLEYTIHTGTTKMYQDMKKGCIGVQV